MKQPAYLPAFNDQGHTPVTALPAWSAGTHFADRSSRCADRGKLLDETAGVDRFISKDIYARHNGTAPLPVWSANHARHRLSRTRNRQLNAATVTHRAADHADPALASPRPAVNGTYRRFRMAFT